MLKRGITREVILFGGNAYKFPSMRSWCIVSIQTLILLESVIMKK